MTGSHKPKLQKVCKLMNTLFECVPLSNVSERLVAVPCYTLLREALQPPGRQGVMVEEQDFLAALVLL